MNKSKKRGPEFSGYPLTGYPFEGYPFRGYPFGGDVSTGVYLAMFLSEFLGG